MAVPASRAIETAEVVWISKQCYTDGPLFWRKMQHWRPRICPFEVLVRFVPPGCSLLDVGCGSGLFILILSGLDREIRAVGVDTSERLVATARCAASKLATVTQHFAPPRFIAGNAISDLPHEQFDVVAMIDVLHHIAPDHQRAAVEAALDRVKSGGILLFKDIAPHPVHKALANRLHDLLINFDWIHYVPMREVQRWGAARGFTVQHGEIIHRLWYAHDLLVLRRG